MSRTFGWLTHPDPDCIGDWVPWESEFGAKYFICSECAEVYPLSTQSLRAWETWAMITESIIDAVREKK